MTSKPPIAPQQQPQHQSQQPQPQQQVYQSVPAWSAWCDKHHPAGMDRSAAAVLAVNPMQGGLWLTMRKRRIAWRGPTEAILTPQAIPPAHQLPQEMQGRGAKLQNGSSSSAQQGGAQAHPRTQLR